MAISFVTSAIGASNSTTSFSITLPATQTGDIIILEFAHRGTGNGTIAGTYSGPAFALKHSQLFGASAFSGKTYWSRATGNHTGQTVTGSGLTNSCAAIVTIYRGALESGDPLAAATVVGEQNASGNVTQAQISTTVANAWVVLVVVNSPDLAVATQACTTPGALTERAERLSTGGTDSSIAHASAAKAGTGGTGAFTWTQSAGASGSWAYAIEPQPADTTAPVLSGQTVDTITAVGGVPKVTTDEGNGTAYMVVVPNGDSPSVAQIKAGQNSSGGAALANQNQAVSATGVQTFSAVTGLTSFTQYDVWFVHTDAASNDSTAVKADFTTAFAFADIRRVIIDGFISAQSEAAGWNVARATIPDSAVVRTSDTIITIDLSALSGLDITAQEIVTAIIPAEATTAGVPLIATPQFTISPVAAGAFTVTVPVATMALGSFAPTVLLTDQVLITPPVGTLRLSEPWTADTDKITADSSLVTADRGAGINPPTVLISAVPAPATGQLTVTGFAPTVVVGDHKVASPNVGALVLTGLAAVVLVSNHITATPATGALTVTGHAPSALLGTMVSPPTGALTVTGFAPAAVVGTVVSPPTGQLSVAGFAPTAVTPVAVTPAVGSLVLTGFGPLANIGVNVAPNVGALEITGFAPTVTVSSHVTVEPAVGTLTLTGFAPTTVTPRTVTPATGSLVLTGFAPLSNIGVNVSPSAGALIVTGFAPTVTASDHISIAPATGLLTLAGFAPAVGSSITSSPATGALSLTGPAPATVVNTISAPATGQLLVTGFAPTVVRTAHVTAEPGTGQLVLTGFSPIISGSANRIADTATGTLTLTGFAPTLEYVGTEALTGSLTLAPSLFGSLTLTPALSGTLDVESTLVGDLDLEPV